MEIWLESTITQLFNTGIPRIALILGIRKYRVKWNRVNWGQLTVLIGVNFITKTRNLQSPLFANIYYTIFTPRTSNLYQYDLTNLHSTFFKDTKSINVFCNPIIFVKCHKLKKWFLDPGFRWQEMCFSDKKNLGKWWNPCYFL